MAISNALHTSPSSLFAYMDRALSKDEVKRRIRELLDHL
jgi:hypothetical protein